MGINASNNEPLSLSPQFNLPSIPHTDQEQKEKSEKEKEKRVLVLGCSSKQNECLFSYPRLRVVIILVRLSKSKRRKIVHVRKLRVNTPPRNESKAFEALYCSSYLKRLSDELRHLAVLRILVPPDHEVDHA